MDGGEGRGLTQWDLAALASLAVQRKSCLLSGERMRMWRPPLPGRVRTVAPDREGDVCRCLQVPGRREDVSVPSSSEQLLRGALVGMAEPCPCSHPGPQGRNMPASCPDTDAWGMGAGPC